MKEYYNRHYKIQMEETPNGYTVTLYNYFGLNPVYGSEILETIKRIERKTERGALKVFTYFMDYVK